MFPVPTSDHNEQLTGDTLTSVSFNYEWRKIIADAIDLHLQKIAATIADESDRQEFEQRCGNLLIDFYNEDVVDNTAVGTISAYVGTVASIPAKWLLCDGTAYNVADYPDLTAVLDPIFIGGSLFTVPDMRDRFLLGSGINDDVGELGGENYHALTIAELPAHHHVVPAHSHTVPTRANAGSNTTAVAMATAAANNSIATDTEPATDTSDTGGATAFNNQPAYIAVHWIIKALP